jgi:glutathione S-transferase
VTAVTIPTLYDYLPSGNGYKVRLVCKHLALPYRFVEMDIKAGATRTAEFLAKNPNGRIPLLEVPGKGFLAESHAIIQFLAEGSPLVPDTAWERAAMWQWLCFEQYHIEPNLGTARFWLSKQGNTAESLGSRLTEKLAAGRDALAVLDKALTGKTFLVGGRLSLADIGVYAYTHVAPEAGVALEAYPAIGAWLARIAAQPRHAPITAP